MTLLSVPQMPVGNPGRGVGERGGNAGSGGAGTIDVMAGAAVRPMTSGDFARRGSATRRTRGVVTVAFSAGGDGIAVGWITPKRLGGAVVRNRWRRRGREIFTAIAADESLPAGNYAISFRDPGRAVHFSELERDLRSAVAAVAHA